MFWRTIMSNSQVKETLTSKGEKIHSFTVWKLLCSAQSLSHVRLFLTPWTVAHQSPLFWGFSRQEYWSGWPYLLQGIIPTQGSNPGLPHWLFIYLFIVWITRWKLLHILKLWKTTIKNIFKVMWKPEYSICNLSMVKSSDVQNKY